MTINKSELYRWCAMSTLMARETTLLFSGAVRHMSGI
jgi:hypothetical protein